jgi:hypothetical protein
MGAPPATCWQASDAQLEKAKPMASEDPRKCRFRKGFEHRCWHQGIHHALLVALFLRYLEISNLCNHRADDCRAAIAQTQQIVEVAFNLPCMRMSKNLPWDEPPAA